MRLSRFFMSLLMISSVLLTACGGSGGGGGGSSAAVPTSYFIWKEPSGITLPPPVTGTAIGSVQGDFFNGEAILDALASVDQPVKIETGIYGNNPDAWYKDGNLRLADNGDGTWTIKLVDTAGATVASFTGYAYLYEGAAMGLSAGSMELFLSPSSTADPRFNDNDQIFDIYITTDAHLSGWYNPASGNDVWFGNGLVDSHGEKVLNALIQLAGTWEGNITYQDGDCTATIMTLTIDTAGNATVATDDPTNCPALQRTFNWASLSDNIMQEDRGSISIELDVNPGDYELELGVDDWEHPTAITYMATSKGHGPDTPSFFVGTVTKQP